MHTAHNPTAGEYGQSHDSQHSGVTSPNVHNGGSFPASASPPAPSSPPPYPYSMLTTRLRPSTSPFTSTSAFPRASLTTQSSPAFFRNSFSALPENIPRQLDHHGQIYNARTAPSISTSFPPIGHFSYAIPAATQATAPLGDGQPYRRPDQLNLQPSPVRENGSTELPLNILDPSAVRQTPAFPLSKRRTKKEKNNRPCRRCKRSHIRCETRAPNNRRLCGNCRKAGLEKCPTPEPQPERRTRANRRRPQDNRMINPSPTPTAVLNHVDDPQRDVHLTSTSDSLRLPESFPPSTHSADISTTSTVTTVTTNFGYSFEDRQPSRSSTNTIQNPIIENSASTSRRWPYDYGAFTGNFAPNVSPSAWPAHSQPRSDEPQFDEGPQPTSHHSSSFQPATPSHHTSGP
ncbi:hypothetical protein BD410DRAFT_837082 [Rickenella mellea]|uniref:Zn(2)-C6 fungal-type domain-containing protein n=1 Tax=Rickenella mellea TaxID=50990 RepID=A0A4Y7QEB0_9AGAM|nr:hypothetical protein BD410DRAFT_837082 [Rickenella mellea]